VSKQTRAELIEAITTAVVVFQEATDQVDALAATELGVNRTDLACIGLLLRLGELTAGELAERTQLSPGATTAAIERLEGAGYAVRTRDEADRRRVLVRPTPLAESRVDEVYGPIRPAGQAILERYTRAELEVIHDFLVRGTKFQESEAARIRAGSQRTV
jgi:DNA-binding MarR family transcriptional regulator